MRRHKPRAFWRLARIWFRRVRITVWLALLLLLLVMIYLSQVGLPRFLQGPLIRAFQKQGLELKFSHLRLSWYKGLVADEVAIQPASAVWAPRMKCRRLDLRINPAALLRLGLAVESLTVTDGELSLPYGETNEPVRTLTVTNINSELWFGRGGEWRLTSFEGELEGCRLSVSGMITNASSIKDWRVLRPGNKASNGPSPQIIREVHRVLDRFQFETPPMLYLGFNVDGDAPDDLSFWLSVRATRAVSERLELEDVEFFTRMDAVPDQGCSQLEVSLQAGRMVSPQARGSELSVYGTLTCLPDQGRLLAGRFSASADRLDTRWAGVVGMDASIGWVCDSSNLMPASVSANIHTAEGSTRWGWAKDVRLVLDVSPFTGDYGCLAAVPADVFPLLVPYMVNAEVEAKSLQTPWLAVTNLNCGAGWSAPMLNLTNLTADLCGGHLETAARVNVATGAADFRLSSNFDPHGLSRLLPHHAVTWLDRFTWNAPPVVSGTGEVTLPKWRRYNWRWPGDLRPNLRLHGQFEVGPGTFRTVPLSGASGHVNYSNMFWHLPDLRIRQPRNSFQVAHVNNDRTHEYLWQVDGPVDPTPALRVLPEQLQQHLASLHLAGPGEAHLEINGRWHQLESTQVRGTVDFTNVTFRGCTFDDVGAMVDYTNRVLKVREPSLRQVDQVASATSLTFDFARERAFLSNGVSTLPPMAVATIIGPQVVRVVKPYQFLNPPRTRVEGVIPLKGEAGADLRFQIEGGPFKWWRFQLPSVQSLVHWHDETVLLTNLQASFYGGTAQGGGFFDFTGKKDADFQFALTVQDADLRQLVAGVFKSEQRLEGRLSGNLVVTNANTSDMGSWFGYGSAELKDGLIWDVPVFGIVSPVLNVVIPGLGNSLAKEAKGTYAITNSVIRTDDLVIRTSNMRLHYDGTVDFNGRVDAQAEAEILRDTFVIGELVSVALTPFSKAMVLRITGTLNEPVAEPLYFVPRVLLAPLNPVKLFKNMFAPPAPKYEQPPPDTLDSESTTNAPAPRPESNPASE